MQLHSFKRTHANKKSRLVGRGGRRGKTSGRGGKGQTARAGHKARPEMRDIIKKLPKLRGRGKNAQMSIQVKPAIISLEALEKAFASNDAVNPETLVAKKLLSTNNGIIPKVKILGDGTLTKKLIVTKCLTSLTAKEQILKAGGSVA